uniref:Uncharacterized LOC100175401 n=1 Tax=Ciona intestinalis TaxID=7719 RepID=F6Y354_CIOIN|nr:uncharacterized protein LOC100175401 isoform X2 [Ciona intestinalis]|eukprot:XP_002124688.1 uncharacterized protein LOC100175401 isoform X2 [Ciona intestinalis]
MVTSDKIRTVICVGTKIMLRIVRFLFLVNLMVYQWRPNYVTGLRNSEASSCRTTVFTAAPRYKRFSSPNFPRKFAEQTQCSWIVQAPLGYRVKLEFLSFYLLGTHDQDRCFVQHLTISDPFTGIQDGPYCGNTSPPRTTSAGRRLKVTLESDAVGIQEYYKGFRIRYSTSLQPPSLRMRDSAGLWATYRVAANGVTVPATTTTVAMIPTRNSNEIDNNNNAAIDLINSRRNTAQDDNEARNNRINEQNNRNVPNTVIITARPDRYVNRRRATIRPPTRNNLMRPRPPTNTVPRTKPKRESKQGLGGGAVAGIVVGLLLVLVLVVGIMYRAISKRKKQNPPTQQHRQHQALNYIQIEKPRIETTNQGSTDGSHDNAAFTKSHFAQPVLVVNEDIHPPVTVVKSDETHTSQPSGKHNQSSEDPEPRKAHRRHSAGERRSRAARVKSPSKSKTDRETRDRRKTRSRKRDRSPIKRKSEKSNKRSRPKDERRPRNTSKSNMDRPKNRA